MNHRGITLLDLVVVAMVVSLLMLIATPQMQHLRRNAAFDTAGQTVAATISRARWMAITSGRPTTTVELTSPTRVSIKNGAAILASADVSAYPVTLSASPASFAFDGRGFLIGGGSTSLTLAGIGFPRTSVITIGPLGKIHGF